MAAAGNDIISIKNLQLARYITLDGLQSFDPDGDELDYLWIGPFPPIQGPTPSVSIPEGLYTISLIVNDGMTYSSIDSASVTINPFFQIAARAKVDIVQLTWTNLPDNERYDVFRCRESNPHEWVKIAETTNTYSVYADTPIANEYTYLYIVGSLSGGTLRYSNVVSSHPTAQRSRGLVNYSPVIYSESVTHGMAGFVYNYDINATDPNNDPLTYSLVSSPTGMTINQSTGLISWGPDSVGTFDCTVQATDGKGGISTQSFRIGITSLLLLNSPPVADAGGPYSGISGNTVHFDGSSSFDPDGDNLTYTWDFGDGTTGMGMNPMHRYPDAGSYTVSLIVDDGRGGTAFDMTNVLVYDVPSLSISADPLRILAGDTSTLSWISMNADSLAIDNGIGTVSPQGSISVAPPATTTYTASGQGNGYTVSDSVTVMVAYPPSVHISAVPETIIAGQSSSLAWTSENAADVIIDHNLGTFGPNGTTNVAPAVTTTYTAQVKTRDGSSADSVTITVMQRPSVSLTTDPQAIREGDRSVLSWISANALTASIDNGIGSVRPNGSIPVSPTVTTTYTISVEGPGGSAQSSATITVYPKPAVSIAADPSVIIAGSTSALSWTSTNASALMIDNGIGTVAVNGSLPVTPSVTTTYVITATGPGGSASASVTVTVHQRPIVDIAANPAEIVLAGATTLYWTSSHADTLQIDNGIGTVPASGTSGTSPLLTTTYTITASGPGGTATDSVTVLVNQPPTVTLSASPNPIVKGETSRLTWTSTNADTAVIDQGIGNMEINGSVNITPLETTLYTITVTGPGGTATASAIVVVNDPGDIPYAYIANNWADDVSVIDLTIDTVITRVAVGEMPYGVEVSPDGNRVYVTTGAGIISVIDTSTNTVVGSVNLMASCIAVSPDCSTVYAVSNSEDSVTIIDAATLTITDAVPVGSMPHGITITPDGTKLYVTNYDGNSISVIDTASRSVIETITLPDCFQPPAMASLSFYSEDFPYCPSPLDIETTPDGTFVYVTYPGDGTVLVIDTTTNTLSDIIDMNIVPEVTATPQYIAISPDGSYACVSFEYDFIALIDLTNNQPLSFYYVEGGLSDMSFTPDGNFIYIPNNWADTVTIFDTCIRDMVYTIEDDFSSPYTCGHFIAYKNFSVSGRIVSASDGSGVPGVRVTLTGDGLVKTAVTDEEGWYDLFVPNGNYTIAPQKPGHSLSIDTLNVSMNNRNVYIPEIEVLVGSNVTVNPTAIKRGESAVLQWNSINASNISISGVGNVGTSGSLTVSPDETTTYIVTAESGDGHSASSTAKLTVYQPPSISFSASSPEIALGRSTTLTWTTSDTYEAAIDNSIGRVVPNGSVAVSPSVTTTYTLTATGMGGTRAVSTTITVHQPPTVNISSDQASIVSGSNAILTWSSTNALSADIDNGIGSVNPSGTLTVSPLTTTTYTITADGAGGTVEQSVTIIVHQAPTVSISAEPSSITRGEYLTLTWDSSHAASLYIDNGVGMVPASGTTTISPAQSMTLTITAAGPGGTATDSLDITVTEPVLTITYPGEGDTIYRPDTLVRGTINTDLVDEVGITVNGVPALISGNQFVANHVALAEGYNTITVTSTDTEGYRDYAQVNVLSEVAGPYIMLSATHELGVAPLLGTTLIVDPAFSEEITSITHTGPGQVEELESDEKGNYRMRIASEGMHYFTVEVDTESGIFTDTVAVAVLNRDELDTLLRLKWDAMCTALEQNLIEQATKDFSSRTRPKFRNAFGILTAEQRERLVSELQDIRFITMQDYTIEYDIRIIRDNEEFSFSLRFDMDKDGLWKISSF